MASAAAPGTVWVGFMDVVPVIGTVKEGVEWVLALHGGNEKVMREKEMFIKNLLEPTSKPPKESMVKGMKKLSVSESTNKIPQTKGQKDPKAAEPKSITEVKLEELLKHVSPGPGGRRETKKREAMEQAEVAKRVEKEKEDFLKKIRLIKPDFVMAEDLDITMRSRRGEHVFNNDILKFHSKVLEFKRNMNISNDPRYEKAGLNGHTLDPNTEQDIKTNMVVHFLESEFYVNANGILYGRFAEALRRALLDVMGAPDPDSIDSNHKEKVIWITDHMNNLEIYVDHLAKMKWINNMPANTNQFNTVKGKVVNMYKNERGFKWCVSVMTLGARPA